MALVCDPFSGNGDPEVLVHLHRAGVRVTGLQQLHAKVYLGPGGAALASANLTPNGLVEGNHEAVINLSPNTRGEVILGIERLVTRGTPLTQLLGSPEQWAVIAGMWESRAAGRASTGGHHQLRAGLLESLRAPGQPDLADLTFSLWADSRVSMGAAAKATKRFRLKLPKAWEFTVVAGARVGGTGTLDENC